MTRATSSRRSPSPARSTRAPRRSRSAGRTTPSSHRDTAAGNPEIDVTVPKTGRFGGVYVQAISAYAPHPNAAKLWMEFLYSDEGQNIWLKGYCNPIRFEDMSKRNAIPAEMLAKLPDTAGCGLPDARPAQQGDHPDHEELGLGRRRGRQVSRPTLHLKRSRP